MLVHMNAGALELAQRTAASAGPFAASLAADCSQIALAMRAGAIGDALDAFDSTASRLGRFLTFVVVASELLGHGAPTLGAVLGDYGRRVLACLDRVQHALDRGDLVGLTLALEHGLGPTLGEYCGYAEQVERGLDLRMAA